MSEHEGPWQDQDHGQDYNKAPRLPTVDDAEPPERVDYQDWTAETTKVVSGPIGPESKFKGRRFRSKAEALRYWRQRAGKVYQDLSIRGRWVFRVRKDA